MEALDFLSRFAQREKVIPDGMGPLQSGVAQGGRAEDQNEIKYTHTPQDTRERQ